jgi:NADH dehydrogenase [ubiquinone] 1 alpha subcomplex assembly factor 5
MFALMRDLQGMAENNAALRRRPYTPRSTIMAAAAIYESLYGKDGYIPATFQIIYFNAWAPHSSQPQVTFWVKFN